jgi:hypothetical protein
MNAGSVLRNILLFGLLAVLALLLLALEVHAEQDIGYLWVTSEPKYVQVYLDGKFVATTPILKLLEVETGQHKIELSRQGYRLREETIVIRRGQAIEINVTLAKPDSEADARSTKTYVEAYITIKSQPSDADVYLDDKLIGRTPVTDYRTQPAGQQNRKLRIVKPGYKSYENWIDIADRIKVYEDVQLEPVKDVVSTRPPVKPRERKKFIVNTQVIILFIFLLVITAVLTTRVIIRLRRGHPSM